MTAREMFQKEGWKDWKSDDNRFLVYEKDLGEDGSDYITIDFVEKTVDIHRWRGETLNMELNKNEVDAFLQLMKELKEVGLW